MPEVACPACGLALRRKPGQRKLKCPACKARFRAPPAPAAAPPPIDRLRKRVEALSAGAGLLALAGVLALQAAVLLPVGRTHPGERPIAAPPPTDDDPGPPRPAPPRLVPFNSVLFWGSVAAYAAAAGLSWLAFWRWKVRLLSPPRAGDRPRSRAARSPLADRHKVWCWWGGGTAAAVLAAGGLLSALLGRHLLWSF
jgi:hypothetical protein